MKISKTAIFLFELMFVILVFTISAAVCTNVFVKAYSFSNRSEELTIAVIKAESAIEAFKASVLNGRGSTSVDADVFSAISAAENSGADSSGAAEYDEMTAPLFKTLSTAPDVLANPSSGTPGAEHLGMFNAAGGSPSAGSNPESFDAAFQPDIAPSTAPYRSVTCYFDRDWRMVDSTSAKSVYRLQADFYLPSDTSGADGLYRCEVRVNKENDIIYALDAKAWGKVA